MNIHVQCCGLAIMLILLIFFLMQKKVGLYAEEVFFKILIISICAVLFDLLTIISVNFRGIIPESVLMLSCKIYLWDCVLVGFSALAYVLSGLYRERQYKKYQLKLIYLTIIEGVVIYFLPVTISNSGSYVIYGPALVASNVFSNVFIIAAIGFLIKGIHKFEDNKAHVVLTWIVLWLIASGVHLLFNEVNIKGYACAVGMVILYIKFENPENNLDRSRKCFNESAFVNYLYQCYDREEKFSVMMITMAWYQANEYESEKIRNGIDMLVEYLADDKEAKVFKNMNEELLIVFPNMSEMAKAYQEIQDNFFEYQYRMTERSYHASEEEFPKTMFVLLPDNMIVKNPDEVLQLFQHVKYVNHEHNDGQSWYISEMVLEDLNRKRRVHEMIIQAMDDDRVEVFYQPIYSSKEGRIVSAEALARIRDTDGNIVNPGEFIQVSEESGLVVFLGEIIFEKVCQFLKNKDVIELGIRYIEINLSVVQCEQRNLADRFIHIMEKYQIDPSYINLEITETASIRTKKSLLENMKSLIEYGVRFSLDDFGNGQSNLDYVIDMPVSIIKFDMTMTQRFFSNIKAKCAMEAAIKMAHDMGLAVVSEGVEEKEQLDTMVGIGVEYIQGYYFSKPIPSAEFIEYVREYNF